MKNRKIYKIIGIFLILTGILSIIYIIYDLQLKEHRDLKILVSYHNKKKIVKNKTYQPIFVGGNMLDKPHKDGMLTAENILWLKNNMIIDNDGENISDLNRHFCEMTMIYWAWKNYDKIGDPKYIGFSHYRRVLQFDSNLEKYDIQVLKHFKIQKDIKNSYISKHGDKDLNILLKTYKQYYPNDYDNLLQYFNGNSSYLRNIFIMPKKMFFEYCAWIFPILLDVHNNINYAEIKNEPYPYYDTRSPGVIAELLTGYFISNKKKQGYKIKEQSINDVYFYLDLLQAAKYKY
jgi:hypothetical protein